MGASLLLFGEEMPDGFQYLNNFISEAEENQLADEIRGSKGLCNYRKGPAGLAPGPTQRQGAGRP